MNKNLTSIIVFPIFLALAFGSEGDESSSGSSVSGSEKSGDAGTAKKTEPKGSGNPVGKSAVINGLEVTVKGAKLTKSVKQSYFDYSAGEDAKLLVLDYKVKNVSKEGKSCLTFADAIKDTSGIEYSSTSDCSMAIKSWVMDELNPGLSKSYQACFEVPEDIATEKLQVKFDCMFESDWFDVGPVK